MHPSAVSPNAEFCEPSLDYRRAAVVRHGTPALRLIGALLVEQHEVWSTGKRDFDMAEYVEWKTTQTQEVLREIRQAS